MMKNEHHFIIIKTKTSNLPKNNLKIIFLDYLSVYLIDPHLKYTDTQTHGHRYTHRHSVTQTHSNSRSDKHTNTHTYLTLTHLLTFPHSFALTHTHTHTHTNTHETYIHTSNVLSLSVADLECVSWMIGNICHDDDENERTNERTKERWKMSK